MKFLNENTRAGPSGALAVRVAIVFAVIGCTLAKVASAADDDYLYCFASVQEDKVTYFSEIFLGDYLYDFTRAQLDFRIDLKNAGIMLSYLSSVHCTFEDTFKKARLELEYVALQRQRFPYEDWSVVHTNWIPGFARPLPPNNSDDSYGRESGGDGCSFGECLDGLSTSHRAVCSTLSGWCETSEELPIGRHCYCVDLYGQDLEGITVPRQ